MPLLAPLASSTHGRLIRLRALATIRSLFGGHSVGGSARRGRIGSRTLLEVERLDQRIALSASRQYPGPVPLPGLSLHSVAVPRPAAAVSLAPSARITAPPVPAAALAAVSVTPSSVIVPTPTTPATVITLNDTGYSSSSFTGYVLLTSVSTKATQQLAAPKQASPDSDDWNITLPAAWKPVGSSPTNTKFYVQLCPDSSAGTLYPATNSAANTVTFAPLPVPSITKLSASKGPITGGNVLQITGANLVDSSGANLVTTVAFYASGANVGGAGGDAITLLPGGTMQSATIQITVSDFTQSWNGKNGQPPLPVGPAGTATLAVSLNLSNTQQTPTTVSPANSYTVGYGPSVTGIAITRKPVANAPLAGGSVLTITGTGFDQKSTVQFSDPVSKKTFTVPSANVTYIGSTQLTVTVPNLKKTFPTDVTVDVLVTSSSGFPSPLAAVDKVTFYNSQYTPLVIRVPQSLAQQGIYLASFALKQAADQKTPAQYGISMQVKAGINGNNVGTFVDSSAWKTYDPAQKVNVMKANPPLSFTTKPDAQGFVTATILYDNYLYSKGMGTSGAAAVLSVGQFPRIVLSSDPYYAAGVPDPSANPGLTYGVLELAVSAIQASNYTAANSFLDITYVDQFGMPLLFQSAPNGPFPANALGTTVARQPTIQLYPSFVATAAASNPKAAAFGELLTSGLAAQILAPAKYLAQIEGTGAEIQATPAPLSNYPSGTLAPPPDPTGVDTKQTGFTKGYFYFVTAVGATGQQSAARPASGQIGMTFGTGNNAMLLNWNAFPNAAIPTATGYHVYRQAGWAANNIPFTAYGDVAKLTSTPVKDLSYIDTGAAPAENSATLPTSNAAYSPLSTYFDEALDTFFTHYQANTFSIYRDGLTLTGNTVDGGEAGTVSFTYQSGSGPKTEPIYGRALLLTDTTNSKNQFVFLDPSSPYLKSNTWMGVQTNLGFSAGYQIFAAAGAAGDGGPADANAIGTANPWKDLQNSIAAAFDRGLATNFSVAPDAWATPPQFSAPATVATGTPGTLQSVPYTYAITGIIKNGQTTLETTLGVLTSVKPAQASSSVRLQWSTAPTGAPPGNAYQSFNLYRAQGSPGQQLSFKKVNNNPIPLPTTGQTVTYVDKGRTATVQPTGQPVSYFAAGTTSDVYAAFMHRMGVNGRSYGYAYDDQGALASTSSIDYLQAAWLTVQPWGTVAAGFLAVDPLPASIRAKDTVDTVNPIDLTHLTIGLQTMAGAGKWAYPVFGSLVGQSVRVTASNLPGVGVGTKALVSYTNGRATLSLSGTSPEPGETYALTLALYNEVTGMPITAVKPVTVTIKTL